MDGSHNHNTNNDDQIMADMYPMLSRCQPVLLQTLSVLIFTTALRGLTDEETDSERLRDAKSDI